ncbi:hypothetical protein [Streptomyces sp. CMSTAAHL-2]|nr:hypothetical protein [Streptomyces sp. CMSTAAHL-2]
MTGTRTPTTRTPTTGIHPLTTRTPITGTRPLPTPRNGADTTGRS